MPTVLATMAALISLGLASALWLSPATAAPGVLGVCADPDNLPFSSSGGDERGLYVDLAEVLAARLGLRTEYVWWLSHFGRRAVRETLLSDRCDAYFALPHEKGVMGRSLTLTRPFLDLGYAIIALPSLRPSRFDDLKGRTIAVQFASTPQIMLSTRDGVQTVTFRLAEEALDALARKEVEAAFVWGPTAGYYNKRKLGGAYQVVPVVGEGLQWKAAIGVKKGNEALRDALDRELDRVQPEILRLADRYGFPLGAPVDLDLRAPGAGPAPASPRASRAVARANPFSGDPEMIRAGRSLFNQTCAHCHSPNAMNPEPTTDLRRLRRRYGERMTEVFYTAVTEGRPAKGMPPWKEGLSEDAIWKILAFLESVQSLP
jgi:ABC-type amino acid transport substrate-binding protein/mono/diheme cytochrome c family protein